MRLRKRAAGLALGAGILFLLGTNVQAGWLFVLCALMLGTLVSGLILPGRMLRGIELERRAPAEVVQGEDAFVDLVVTNRARGIRLGLTLDDTHVAPTSLYLMKIAPGERVEMVTARPADKRGVQEDSVVTVRSAAPFGVAERRRTLRVAGSTIVLPAVVPLGPLPFLANASDPSRRPAPCRTVDGSRVPGDPRVPAGRQPASRSLAVDRPDGNGHGPRAGGGALATGRGRRRHARRRRRHRDAAGACCTAAASIARVAIGEGHGIRTVAMRAGRSVDVVGRRRRGPAPPPRWPRSSPTACRSPRRWIGRPRRSATWTWSS